MSFLPMCYSRHVPVQTILYKGKECLCHFYQCAIQGMFQSRLSYIRERSVCVIFTNVLFKACSSPDYLI